MRYLLRHITQYTYQQPVTLRYHTLRLQPRSDAAQHVLSFDLDINPQPRQKTTALDSEGNATLGVWFSSATTESLTITTTAEVITHRSNPFDYLAEPWATTLPLDYPTTLAAVLFPYLHNPLYPVAAPNVIELAQTIVHEVEGNVGVFLTTLTQRIYETCQYTTRTTGNPWPPGITWAQKLGSCRDLTVLFMEACRVVGLAARFVSGYEEGDKTIVERDLHAWAEVYIPGGGWRGFDPTHGLAVSDHHIVLAASAFPAQTLPVSGTTVEGGQVNSSLETTVRVEVMEP